jgi:DNA-binding LacI/PurR family transcriptional regulator
LPRPTIRDVAREAGVGLGTVSRVLGGSPRVAQDTRQRVNSAIARLGYHPNPSARALPRGRAQTIEVIVPLLTRYFYFEVLRGVLAAVADTDYCLNIRVLERPADRDRAFAQVDRRGHPDGLLVVRVPPTGELMARLGRAGVPAVLLDAHHADLPGVGVDHGAAAAAMVAHLVSLGHRRVALVDRARDPFDQSVLSGRRRGYRAALARAGIGHRSQYERDADWSAEGGAAALDALLALPEPPTAVWAGSDTQAIGVLDRARQRGLTVPGDLAVCGYGDIELARYLGLTTVRVPMRALGERAVALLLDAIERGVGEKTHLQLPTELVVRTTCGTPSPRA